MPHLGKLFLYSHNLTWRQKRGLSTEEGGKNRLDLYLFVEFLCQNVLEYKNEYYLLNIYLYKYIGTYLGFAYSMVLCVLHFQIT